LYAVVSPVHVGKSPVWLKNERLLVSEAGVYNVLNQLLLFKR
jgi:hypothetical protein